MICEELQNIFTFKSSHTRPSITFKFRTLLSIKLVIFTFHTFEIASHKNKSELEERKQQIII